MKQEKFNKLLLESKFIDEVEKIFKAIEERLNVLEARVFQLEKK